jgi:Tol biopolymer transport system component/predicted Ser/Thr protein kinase
MSDDAPNPHWAEIERAFDAVLELPDEQREQYLARQPAPIREEVESLLAAYRRSGSFLGKQTGAPPPPHPTPDPVAIQSGTQLGAYRIESVIGEGGMGVVYRALDARLNRPVAVKFLFDDLADEAARRRFQREARMASSLNHPHILTVYDAGDFEGRQYLVSEFIDGGTLRDWARAEKRSWREIVALLVGLADGLAAAHTAGILHRDIKPDNILVGRNGYAKLSDFGLAKLDEGSTPDAVTGTLRSRHTHPGVVLGTIPYMSPEQASGRPTDARGDIFSFGIVLYELLAGRRPFDGATDLETLQAIIHGAAPPLGPEVPLALRLVVEKALDNSPAERYQTARDLVVDLRRLSRQSGEASAAGAPAIAAPVPAHRRWKAGALAAIVLLAVSLGAVLLMRFERPPAQVSRQVVQFDIPPPPGTIFTPTITRQSFAISPDGSRLALTATGRNGTNIWVRDLASLEMRAVPGTEGAWSVFWSPDSRSIYYSLNRVLKQTNLDTGSGRSVADIDLVQFGTWRSNGDLLLFIGTNDVRELRGQDGSVRRISLVPGVRWLQFLPGGDRFVYAISDPGVQRGRAMAADYVARQPVNLMETDSRVQYAPPRRPGESGYLLFLRAASLLAQPFDADHLRLAGAPFPIAQNIVYYGPVMSANFSVSSNGVLVYQAGFPEAELKWYDRAGREIGTAGRPALLWGQVRLSRDGKRVAATVWSPANGGTGIWVFDANGSESRKLTFPPEVDRRPVWSPDAKLLAVGRSPTVGSGRLAILDSAGSGKPQPFSDASSNEPGPHQILTTDWSWDGRFIVSDDGVGQEVQEVWVADVASRKFFPLLQNKFPQWGTVFSPDGRQIAFVSVESGRPEVYVQAFEAAPSPHVVGDRRQVSRDGACLVRWRADGRELFVLGTDNLLQAVPVQGILQVGEPKPLFRIPGAPQFGTTRDFQFDVSPDGQRFIIPTTGSVPPPPITVIENWQDKFPR